MMKILLSRKNLLCILMILAMSLQLTGVGYADSQSVAVSLTSPGAHQVYKPGDPVDISGTAQGLAEVSIAVRDESGVLVFTAQPRVQDGAFSAGFTLEPAAAEGQYTINVGSLGLPDLKTYRFQVRSAGGAVVTLTKPAAGAAFKAGDVVEIAGTAQRTGAIAICVRNSRGGRVYVAQPPLAGGSFTTHFTMAADALPGNYTVAVTGDGLAAAQTYQFAVTSTGGSGSGPGAGPETKPDAILSISGSGVPQKVSFSRADLVAMGQQRELFSALNEWPQKLFVAAEGVPLRTLLNQAGMSANARVITFTGSDGYSRSFTVDELLNTTRYRFPGQTPVEPLIALKRAEASTNFGDINESETPVLCYGQRAETDYTMMSFVKYLTTITVSTSDPGQWSKPAAKIIDPNTQQKTETQGGEVSKGSKIVLEGELRTKIYYTIDGADPDLNSNIYNISMHVPDLNKPIPLDKSTTLKAVVIGYGKRNSEVLTLKFTVPGTGQASSTPVTAVDEKNIKKELIDLENGRKEEKLTLLASALEDIEKGEQGSRLALTSTADVDKVSMEVPAATLLKAQEKGMLLGVDSQIGNYTLPLAALNLGEIAAGLGVKPEELSLNIVISRATEETKDKLAAQVREGQQMLVDPVEFTVEITAPDGRKVEYKSFGGVYVARELALGGEVNVNQAIGAVWSEAGNEFSPVPTRFEARDGKSYAVILNRTNSLYTVLQFAKTFADIQANWAKDDIELLASKMLINGKSETAYEPDSNITRAEFAALLVRALGLEEGVLKEGQFADVAGTDWYAGSVAAATAENIIKGYDGNLFKPDDNITREEMAAMIARAVRVAGQDAAVTAGGQEQLLAQFSDRPAIAAWAAGDAALAAKAGIIRGMPDGNFAPQAYADRAQSAAMLKRFLIYVNFISVSQPDEQQTDTEQTDTEQSTKESEQT